MVVSRLHRRCSPAVIAVHGQTEKLAVMAVTMAVMAATCALNNHHEHCGGVGGSEGGPDGSIPCL